MNLTSTLAPPSGARAWRWIALFITAISCGAVVSTYKVFNNLYDEPAHLAAGMEWLSRGTFTYEPQHPPLSRVAAAILPWLAGERSAGNAHMFTEGRLILGRGEHYRRVLALARLGALPFFLFLVFVTWYWARRLSDERTAAFAVAFVATNSNVLAHAGVAGTDIGPAALMPAALLAWAMWLEQPSVKRSVGLGALVALCGLTKFSAGAYWLPAAMGVAVLYALRNPGHMLFMAGARRLFRPFVVALASASLMTWAMYRFSVGPVGALTLPAPEFWIGLRDFFRHGTGGHPAYLFGQVKLGGWWYYDLVAVLVKTPVPLMLFGAIGSWAAICGLRDTWRGGPAENETGAQKALRAPADNVARAAAESGPRSGAAEYTAPLIGLSSVLLVASATPVDIGIRLDLPLYPMLAVLAGLGLTRTLDRARHVAQRAVIALLCTWAVASPIAAHPDHIAYFNLLAGRDPSKILVDSNLDWGQDLYRLRDATKEFGIDSLRVHYFGTAEFAAVGLERAQRLRPDERATGWVAASETFYAGVWSDTSLAWLHAYEPVAHVGKSIRLYFIKP